MIETIAQTHLAVGETLSIRRNHITPVKGENRGRISVVTGMHGDELEGQFVCYELIRSITEHIEDLRGTVDVYPVLNPLGMDSGSRVVPKLDMDMNRMFPGSQTGNFMDQMVYKIADSIKGSDVCIDVHASDRFVREIPQARISDEFEQLMTPYAKQLNVDVIWINTSSRVHDSTLANSLCNSGTPSLVLEMGLGNRIHPKYGRQIVDGILHLM
nr:succinylglutamate desuccinylase/aspartoacylase family protein [Lachnospiraceae bacterium]